MKSILRSTAILSSSSIATLIVGLLSAKIYAVLLGPTGLGFLGLLQSLVGLMGLLAGAGIGTGLVRMGASALAKDDEEQVAALQRSVWYLFWAFGLSVALLMIILREPLSMWMLGSSEHSNSVVLVTVALLFTLASGIQVSRLNAYHRVGALAQYGVLNSVAAAAFSASMVWFWGVDGIVPATISSAVMSWVIATWLTRRELPQPNASPSRRSLIDATRALLNFGVPYSASMLVGTGVHFVLPPLVLYVLGTQEVGWYRAAVAISVTYLGFLLTAMGMDYYPRLSAARDQPAKLVHLVNEQLRLILLLIVPLIFGLLALAQYLVPLIYSSEFRPSVQILEWQLIGDLLKFASWTMGTVVLARSRSRTIFGTELLAGVNMLAFTWIGLHLWGLQGAGIGFLGTYAVHYVVLWLIVRRDIGLVLTTTNRRVLVAVILAALGFQAMGMLDANGLRIAVTLSLATAFGLWSAFVIWKEVTGRRTILPGQESDSELKSLGAGE
jgi:enterobacterial common antigen flippase